MRPLRTRAYGYDLRSFEPDRRVDVDLVLLRARLRFVFLIDQLQRALPDERVRQDHHPDEARRPVRCRLREHRLRSVLEPGRAGAIAGRAPVRVDADPALDQAADAGALMPMQIGATAGRERDAV